MLVLIVNFFIQSVAVSTDTVKNVYYALLYVGASSIAWRSLRTLSNEIYILPNDNSKEITTKSIR